MRYLKNARPRVLLVPVAFLALIPLTLLQFATLGAFRGLKAAVDFLDWTTYDNE